MDFVEVQAKVFDLYGKGRYEAGLEVIADARPEHPDHDGRLTFWRACLLSIAGRPGQALEVLEAGLARGLWWGPGMLADSDLVPARDLPGWDELLARCGEAAADARSLRPGPHVRPATARPPKGTLVTLHGAGADPMAHAERWGDATPDSWTVITPAGDVPMAPGDWAWPFDLALAPLSDHLESLELTPPLMLAGWSQGGGMAASMAWMGGLEVDGLLLFGPGLRDAWDPASHRRVPTYIVIGENDLNLGKCLELRDRMREHGVAVSLDERPGQGHEPPADLADTIAAALDWLVAH